MSKARKIFLAFIMALGLSLGVGIPQAQAYAGDHLYNCGNQACDGVGYYVYVLDGNGFKVGVGPGHMSPTNLQGFYVENCFRIKNVNTGYVYGVGYHKFAWSNAFISVYKYYVGSC